MVENDDRSIFQQMSSEETCAYFLEKPYTVETSWFGGRTLTIGGFSLEVFDVHLVGISVCEGLRCASEEGDSTKFNKLKNRVFEIKKAHAEAQNNMNIFTRIIALISQFFFRDPLQILENNLKELPPTIRLSESFKM